MQNIKNGLTGAIITDHGNTILAKGIRFFMRMYGRLKHRMTGIQYNEPYGNHARIIIATSDITGKVCVCEAVKDGVVIKWIYLEDEKDYKLFQLRIPLKDQERARLWDAAFEVKGRPYQVWNFFAWMIYIGSGTIVNTFRREPHSSGKFYCYELVAYLSNKARPGLFDDYEEITSIYDIESNPGYKEITI